LEYIFKRKTPRGKEKVVSMQLNASKYRNKIKYMYLLKRSNKSRVNLIHNSLFSECKSEVVKLLEQIDSSTKVGGKYVAIKTVAWGYTLKKSGKVVNKKLKFTK
jgi:Zn-dependent M32 family carboxypeptidase